ncbi:Hypothetical predicted protein [Mytilus galloprovincialis]|uniref:Uncharacterized protein n=1 Tax=Mytilus galloprovincialis TaxID=29158 RepID=A0A8B6G0T0_MYTGA|nr:Hypothetical predicted protein [Mytilus galloprovincialis]
MSGAAKKGPGNLKLLKDAFFITTGGTVMFAGHQIYKGNEKFYKEYVMPFFHLFDAETSHKMAVKAAKYKLVPKSKITTHPVLASRVFDRDFPSPVGLAAGFDKDGEAKNEWAYVKPLQIRRSRVAMVASYGKLFAIGGYDGIVQLTTVESYEPDKDEWKSLQPMCAHEGGVGVGILPIDLDS